MTPALKVCINNRGAAAHKGAIVSKVLGVPPNISFAVFLYCFTVPQIVIKRLKVMVSPNFVSFTILVISKLKLVDFETNKCFTH